MSFFININSSFPFQSLPMTPPDEPRHSSHRKKGSRHNHHDVLDDDAISYINKTLQSYGVPTINHKNIGDKYRSYGDLRRSDSYRSRRASQIDVNLKPKVKR